MRIVEHIDQNDNSPADEGGHHHTGVQPFQKRQMETMHSCAHRLLQNNIVRQKKMNNIIRILHKSRCPKLNRPSLAGTGNQGIALACDGYSLDSL